MTRRKGTLNFVDLSMALKTAKAAGLIVAQTKVGADGSFTLVHFSDENAANSETAESALVNWQLQKMRRAQ